MNSSHENISEELLARYLADTASEGEKNQVEIWLAQSDLNRQEFANYRLIWDHAGSVQKKFTVDTDLAWNKIKMKMDKKPAIISSDDTLSKVREVDFTQTTIQKKLPIRIWAVAAVTLLILSFGWFHFRSLPSAEQRVATTNNTTEKVLPDGTKVFLNYNSSITFPENFDGDFRTVSLQGEAFFDVKPDAAHPFIINANGTEIRVLGTSFNVKAYKEAPVRVDVSTGKVRVSKASHKIDLIKGESAEVLADTIRSLQANMNIMGYKTQIFDFNAANLNDVVSSIREGYHVDVRLSNQQIAQCRLTIRFEKEPLDATLAVIAETLDLDLRKEGKVYWLDGNGCQ
ncbi:FecR family protein [Dyadobacter pollutisoli]|jgi:ferric-dicitrate binding protein FerR (iron transport regulator)|uniref:FecR domain-containing protein n=1 Tax=Dyadobacter pollutisoli TaxID=2910158 RepID=A0A9E8SK85_9BACT|nr:FecR domain-containing protein [Dyadobacter pollutisoli]WAC12195.1 FecR domain-containing protein [Dyadobacter pollutisoli]